MRLTYGTTGLMIAVTLLAAAAGCGDDVSARDYEGTWLMTEMTVDDNGTPLTVRRDGVAQALRGDVLFTATGDDTATMSARQTLLVDGLMVSPAFETDLSVVVEADRWVMTDTDGEVTVFTTELTDDHLALVLDPADPRMTATDPPSSVIVDRVTPWSTTSTGDWDLVSLTVNGTTVQGGVCTEIQTGTAWAIMTMVISIDDRLLFTRTMTLSVYSNATCTTMIDQQNQAQDGYGEEEADTTLRMWAYAGGNAEFLEFSMALAGDTLTLTRGSCLPLPGCTDGTPTEVVVRRRP